MLSPSRLLCLSVSYSNVNYILTTCSRHTAGVHNQQDYFSADPCSTTVMAGLEDNWSRCCDPCPRSRVESLVGHPCRQLYVC